MNDRLQAHEMYCQCYGGDCRCQCQGYTGALDELTAKLKLATDALELIKKTKGDYIQKKSPGTDPVEVSTTYRIADKALCDIKDSIYG